MATCHTPTHPGVYERGADVLITASFYDRDEELADPTSISVVVTDPNGAANTYALALNPAQFTHDSLGVYTFEVPNGSSISGEWQLKFTAVTGGDTAVTKVSYKVRRP